MPEQPSALDTLLDAAVLAPSGDNTQPWRFTVDRSAGEIRIYVDPSRDPSPMNAGQRMARIAIGAALENMVRTAEHHGWGHSIDESPPEGVVGFRLDGAPDPGSLEPRLRERVTNRSVYGPEPVPEAVLQRLVESSPLFPDTRVGFITDRERLARLVEWIARADALMLSNRRLRDAFLAKVRFDRDVDAVVEEGLSLGSLGVGKADQLMLRFLRGCSVPDPVMRLLGGRRTFASVSRRLGGSASGFCLITATHSGPIADVHVGRAWQEVWLRLTGEQLACQPMMSLPVFRNIFENGDPDIFWPADQSAIRRLLEEFERWVADFIEGTPAAIMRFGRADTPRVRVGRLPAQAVEAVE